MAGVYWPPPLTCAQQHFAFAQVLDGFSYFAQTLLRQVRWVSEDDVEALRGHTGLKRQRLFVVIEDEVIAVGGEAAIVLKHHSWHPIWAVHYALLQLLVHTGRAHTRYPEKERTCKHTWNPCWGWTRVWFVAVCVCVFTCLPLQLHVWPPLLTESLSRHCTRTGSSAGTHTQKIKIIISTVWWISDWMRKVSCAVCTL